MKALVGDKERITLAEASDIREKSTVEFSYYMCSMIDEAIDDEDERSNAKVNLASKLGSLLEAQKLEGILTDPDVYLEQLRKYTPNVRIEEVPEND